MTLTEEQQMLRDAARDWARERSPVAALRRLRDGGDAGGFDPALWAEMAEMGWSGVLVPEAHGGSDFGFSALALVLAETGRTLTASPLLSTAVIGASALTLAGSEAQQAAWLPRIAAGDAVVALAVDDGPHHAPERMALGAERANGGWRLAGEKRFVPEGGAADLFIVAARTGAVHAGAGAVTLFLVEAAEARAQPRRLADSRGWADVRFDTVAADRAVLGDVHRGDALLEQVLDRARVALAAEMLGSAAEAFEITLAYLKTRTQFGQLIGGFQALQHRAAQMFTELELARSCVEAAAAAVDAGAPDLPALASLAKAKANDVFHRVSNEMVQMHGGIGMTDEHDAGFYLKRARTAEALYGSSAYHRDRYARLAGF